MKLHLGLATTVAAVITATTVNAAVLGYEAVDGGEMESATLSLSGDANGTTGFSLDPNWTFAATRSPASASFSIQDLDLNTFALTTKLGLSLIEQSWADGLYQGVYSVDVDTMGVWGDYAILEISADTFAGFGVSDSATVKEARQAINAIPLPAGGVLLLSGLLGIGALNLRKKVSS